MTEAIPVGHPVFWVLLAAVGAPLLAEIPIGVRLPVVVIEVVLGILIGPQVLGLVQFDGFVAAMFKLGMAASLFMAGMELDWARIRGRPIVLAAEGWVLSLMLGLMAIGVLHVVPFVNAPLMVGLALVTTSLGVLLPVLRDSGRLNTRFGSLFVAVGTVGEVGPIVAMSLLLSQQYSTWQEAGFLLVFLAIVVAAASIGMGARPPRVLAFLGRHMHASSQFPVRLGMLMLAGLFVLAEEFGFESIFGAFGAGLIVGLATRSKEARPIREKFDGIVFGWFMPFFFVGTGIKFDIAALTRDLTTMALVPTFLALFLVVRGAPVFLYRSELEKSERLPFALYSAVASLSIVVVITDIGTRTRMMDTDIAAALVGAALLSVMVYPTIAGILSRRREPPMPG